MALSGENILLRIYVSSADRTPHVPTYERLVKAARAGGLAGATVLRGVDGFGARGRAHRSSAWALVARVPVIVEIVDTPDAIARFVAGPMNDAMIDGIATMEHAHVMFYRSRQTPAPSPVVTFAGEVAPLSTLPAVPTQPGGRMTVDDTGMLLRIFIGESDRTTSSDGKTHPLHEAIVRTARELGLAGATVLRGVEGFGASSVVHKNKLMEMSADMPIVIEIVDREAKVRTLLPKLDTMVSEGMITMENVRILSYRART